MAEQDASFAESVRNRPLDRHSAPRHLLRGLPDSPDIPRPVMPRTWVERRRHGRGGFDHATSSAGCRELRYPRT